MGYGDDIMSTADAIDLHKTQPGQKVAIGNGARAHWSSVFDNNPRLATPHWVDRGKPVTWCNNYRGHRPYINYRATLDAGLTVLNDKKPTRRNLLRAAGKWVWKYQYKVRPGEMFFTAEEKIYGQQVLDRVGPFVIIEPNIKPKASPNKDWGLHRYVGVTRKLNDVTFIQVGDPRTSNNAGVSFVGTPTFRIACSILSRASAYLGPEGGLHHAAAAFDIPAVVIFGGYISPKITGYDSHINFADDEICGMRRSCSHCKEAMRKISVVQVIEAIRSVLP